jgi:hypothetical protein
VQLARQRGTKIAIRSGEHSWVAAFLRVVQPRAFVFGFARLEDAFADERRSDSHRILGVPPESTKCFRTDVMFLFVDVSNAFIC